MASRLGVGPFLPRSALGVLARVLAGSSHLELGAIERQALDLFAETAVGPALERLASEHGLSRRVATFAAGSARFTGSDGSFIPVGAELQRPSDAEPYRVSVGGVVAGGSIDLPIRGTQAGAAANAPEGQALNLVNPLAGIDSGATLVGTDGASGGGDAETDSSLRSRLLNRRRNPIRGGAEDDYPIWAREVPGVDTAFALPAHLGLGSVGVVITAPDESGGPSPSAQLVAQVQAYIDARRPVTALALVFGPTVVDVDLSLRVTPTTQDARDAVAASVADFLRRIPTGGTVLVSQLREAISAAPGETDHTLFAPTADIELAVGEIARLGVITWL